MKKKIVFNVFLLLFLIGCNRTTKTTNENSNNESIEKSVIAISKSNAQINRDSIRLDNSMDKKIFKVLSMLPKVSFGGVDWPKEDRELIYSNALDNIMINESDYFLVKNLVSQSQLKVGVVDGSWELLIYNTSKAYDIVLTHPKTGDGDKFFTYKFDGKKFSEIKHFFPDNYINYFFKSPKSADCKVEADGEFELMLDYYLSNDTVEIHSYYAKDDSSCFLGNTLILVFNDKTEKLEYNSVYWTDKKY